MSKAYKIKAWHSKNKQTTGSKRPDPPFFGALYTGAKQVDAVSSFKPGDFSGLLLATRLALTIALPLLAALLLGRYLGRIYGYEVFFIFAGAGLGLAAGIRQVIRILRKK